MEWELDNEFMAGMCTTLVTLMFMVGLALVGQSIDSCPEVEDPNDMMATSAYSHDKYVKKNWRQMRKSVHNNWSGDLAKIVLHFPINQK